MRADNAMREWERVFGAEWYQIDCRNTFGRHASSKMKFLKAHWKKGMRPKEPTEDFNAVVGEVFNQVALGHIRASVWDTLERQRDVKGFSQEELTSRQGLVAATYAKISAGTTSLDSIALLLRPLDLEFRDLPFPSRCRATITGLQAVVPLVRYEALCDIPPPHSAQQTLSREDVEWLFHLDLFGKAWEQASASSDARAGTIISTCAAASIALRLCKKIQTRPFTSLQQFRLDWFDAWEACLKAIPTGRME